MRSISVRLKLPYIADVEGTWEPDDREGDAAWELYVELATRVAVVGLEPGRDLLREALTSLREPFDITRGILRRYGPAVAHPHGESHLSLGYISLAVLNGALRPVLTEWHPALQDWEARREPETPPFEHENAWERSAELRAALNGVRLTLDRHADVLTIAAGVWRFRALRVDKAGGPGGPQGLARA